MQYDENTGEITDVVEQDQPKVLTAADVVEKLIPFYHEIELLNADTKAILKEAKEAGLPHSMLGKIAKAKALQKLEDLQTDTNTLLDLIEELE